MCERLENKSFVLTVEGDTEKWYLYWLRDQINCSSDRSYNISIIVNVENSPRKFYKKTNSRICPEIYHICDIECNDEEHTKRMKNIISEMKEAKKSKGIHYDLGYSNFTFELWMILHRKNCYGLLSHRKQYLSIINDAFDQKFNSLDQYKREKNLKKCLTKLSLNNVKEAILRADSITTSNEKDQKEILKYKGYSYYKDNPSLSVHCVVKKCSWNVD